MKIIFDSYQGSRAFRWICLVTLLIFYYLVAFFSQNQALVPAQILLLGLPAVFFLPVRLKNIWSGGNTFHSLIKYAVITVFLTLLMNGGSYLQEQLGWSAPELDAMMDQLLHTGTIRGFFWDVFALAIVPAICEELMFRGLIQNELEKSFSSTWVIFLSGLIFALYHLNPWNFVFILILGCYFSWLKIKTQSFALSMLAHFINNAIGVLGMHILNK